jgi:hypothetical protein
MPTLLDPRKVRRDKTINIDLGDDTFVTARKADMTVLMLEGKIPMPLLVAVQQMVEMPNATVEQRIAALGSDQAESFIQLLRRHALAVVIAPPLSWDDTDDPDVLPVTYFELPQLMAIWTETAVVPLVSHEEAATFRPDERSVHADDAQPRASVRPTTVVMAPADGELVGR